MHSLFPKLITALITPFSNDKLDLAALKKLMNFQIDNGIRSIVVGGSTGEGNSLEENEYEELITNSVNIANNRAKIIAGISAVSTKSAMMKVEKVSKLGVNAIMCTPPHYIRPMQNGIVEHFSAISNASNLPIMLYSHLGRTGTDFTDETIITLAKLPNIVALKDAGADINRHARLKSKLPSDFLILTGNDENTVAFNANGGDGCISVASNIAPKLCLKIQEYCIMGDFKNAFKLQQELFPLYEALFLESNPIGIKYAASQMELCLSEARLPLTQPKENTKSAINLALKQLMQQNKAI